MSDSTIGVLQATGPDRLLDAESLTVSAQTVYRERNRVAGGAATELADVRNAAPGTTDFGLVVRQVDNTVKAASTAAVAADKALVVAISPNNGAKITDGTNTAAVKAASTAAAATDPALVTVISPNLPQTAATGTISTAGANTVLMNLLGASSLTLFLDFDTPGGVGTIEFLGLSTASSLTTATILSGRCLDFAADEVLPVADVTSAWEFDVSGYVQFGITVTGPVSGSVTYVMRTGMSGGHVTLASSLPPGTNIIGAVSVTDGTNTAAVKAASTAAVAADKALVVAINPQTAINLPTGASTSANQTTVGSQTTKINDGTRTATIKAASTAAAAADTALVVAISPNNGVSVINGANTAAVKAASTAAAATDPALVVAISPNNTVPVSAASLPLPAGAATSANQTTINTQTTMINDGTNTATVKAASTAAVAADKALVVALSPNNGAKITDGTNTAAVKAASTAAAATDPALVVAVSPNNTVTVAGAKTNNNAAPGATNAGVIPALANAAAPAWTEGNLVLLSADLVGNLRVREPESTLMVTATAAVNTGSTATLPAAGAGLFHYITKIELVKLYSIIGVAAGAGVIVTSTNLPGGPAWTTQQLASPAGTCVTVIDATYARPLKSSAANTNTTFVAGAQLQTIWRWNITYYTAP